MIEEIKPRMSELENYYDTLNQKRTKLIDNKNRIEERIELLNSDNDKKTKRLKQLKEIKKGVKTFPEERKEFWKNFIAKQIVLPFIAVFSGFFLWTKVIGFVSISEILFALVASLTAATIGTLAFNAINAKKIKDKWQEYSLMKKRYKKYGKNPKRMKRDIHRTKNKIVSNYNEIRILSEDKSSIESQITENEQLLANIKDVMDNLQGELNRIVEEYLLSNKAYIKDATSDVCQEMDDVLQVMRTRVNPNRNSEQPE